jgi:hypothetical protein
LAPLGFGFFLGNDHTGHPKQRFNIAAITIEIGQIQMKWMLMFASPRKRDRPLEPVPEAR